MLLPILDEASAVGHSAIAVSASKKMGSTAGQRLPIIAARRCARVVSEAVRVGLLNEPSA